VGVGRRPAAILRPPLAFKKRAYTRFGLAFKGDNVTGL
jgi:hypothetical protein